MCICRCYICNICKIIIIQSEKTKDTTVYNKHPHLAEIKFYFNQFGTCGNLCVWWWHSIVSIKVLQEWKRDKKNRTTRHWFAWHWGMYNQAKLPVSHKKLMLCSQKCLWRSSSFLQYRNKWRVVRGIYKRSKVFISILLNYSSLNILFACHLIEKFIQWKWCLNSPWHLICHGR